MNTFNNKHIVWLHTKFLATLHALARREIITRKFHLLTLKESLKLLVEEFKVKGMY